jgi:hypothetical protein
MTSAFSSPPPERGRTVAAGDQVGVLLTLREQSFDWFAILRVSGTPTRLAFASLRRADLPLSGGGEEERP